MPGLANAVAPAARTAASLSSIDSRTSLAGAPPVVATSVASASARTRPGVPASPATSASAFPHGDSGGMWTPESRSRIIACSRAAGSPSRNAFAPPTSSQNPAGSSSAAPLVANAPSAALAIAAVSLRASAGLIRASDFARIRLSP